MMSEKSYSTHTNPAVQTSQMPPEQSYSREFKLETGQLLKSRGKTKADLERVPGLYPGANPFMGRGIQKEGSQRDCVEQAFPGTAEITIDRHMKDKASKLRILKSTGQLKA